MTKDFYTARMATAKRDYKCGDCGCEIFIGMQYERATYGWGGFVERLKTCLSCIAIRTKPDGKVLFKIPITTATTSAIVDRFTYQRGM